MFDRFTDRARKTMGLARQAAQRWNHGYIGTEHILCGLVEESSGIAARTLKSLGVDLSRVRPEIEKLVATSTTMVTMGQLPFTPRAKKALELSLEESYDLGHTYIGTEHLLLGLIREKEGVGARVLDHLNVKIEDVRKKVLELLAAEPGDFHRKNPQTSPSKWSSRELAKFLEAAAGEAKGLGRTPVQPEHLLLALLRDEKGMAATLLAQAGVNVAAVRAEIEKILRATPPAGGASQTP